MNSYITIPELRKPPFNIAESTMDNCALEFLCEVAYELINLVCCQNFMKEGATGSEVTKEARGTGTVAIYLDKRLITLKEVIIDGIAYTPDNFIVSPFDIRWKDTSDITGRYTSVMLGGVFPESVGLIQVKGIWGYDPIPDLIKYVAGRLVQKVSKEGSMADKAGSESIGDYSYSKLIMTNAITNDQEIDVILKKYRRVKINVPV